MKKSVLILAYLAACASVHAEPDSNIKWAMNTPVSLFDMGIYLYGEALNPRVEKSSMIEAVSREQNVRHVSTDASYGWDENEILIEGWFLAVKDSKDPSKKCAAVLHSLHFAVLLLDETFENLELEALTRKTLANHMGHHWSHQGGYQDPDTPEDFFGRLADRVVVQVRLTDTQKAIPRILGTVTCRSKLGSSKVSVTLPE